MFTTFCSTESPSPTGGDSSAAAPASRPRPKRSQVVRACDRCRQHRTKCDTDIPCSHCRSKGAHCSNDSIRATPLPQAYREIESLRRKVRELELELQEERSKTSPPAVQPLSLSTTPELSSSTTCSGAYGDLHKFFGGVLVSTTHSPHKTWYGPSSTYHFLGRIAGFLSSSLQQEAAPSEHMLVVNAASMLIDDSAKLVDGKLTHARHYRDPFTDGVYLNPTQEEYFLDLYWQSHHTSLYPIINEAEFRDHYRSLRSGGGVARAPSALVDIVLAISMQFGVAALPKLGQKEIVDTDASVAGRCYYRRCQRLLEYELESPTISTLQCHVLTAVYLCLGTFHNMADNATGLATRTAHMLGLHIEPPETMPLKEQELRRRLWWSLYVLDSCVCMKLGRPSLVELSPVSPVIPGDKPDEALRAGSNFGPLSDNVSWLSFHIHCIKLYRTARAAYLSFYQNSIQVQEGHTIWDDPVALESHAVLFKHHGEMLDAWAAAVPHVLTTKRANSSSPFPIDGSSLVIEPFAPMWVQRQRVVLEMLYHNLCTNLYRPFISFTHPAAPSSLAGQAAIRCILHAVTLTQMTHQGLSTTSILAGWHEAFQWQWNASVTLVGFVMAYPRQPPTATARTAIDMSIEVFDALGENFDVATSAAKIMREFGAKCDMIIQQSRDRQGGAEEDLGVGKSVAASGASPMYQDAPDGLLSATKAMDSASDSDPASVQGMLQMAFAVVQWSDLDMIWPQTDTP